MNKIAILALGAVFAVSMIAITAFEVEAVKPQAQTQGTFVDGKGFIQSITCPDLSQPVSQFVLPTQFRFVKGLPDFGTYQTDVDSTSLAAEFVVSWLNAEIKENDFNLIGSVIFKADEFCTTPMNIPSKATLTGNCGLGETATLTTEQGFVVELNTDVVCG